VGREFELPSGQAKYNKIGISYFTAKRTILESKIKDWLTWIQDNVRRHIYP